MKYHAPTQAFTVEPEHLAQSTGYALYAIRKIKEAAGLPLTPYKRTVALNNPDFAMRGIIDAFQRLGIDLGAQWGNDIDSSNHG
jgi:hypothetical protein